MKTVTSKDGTTIAFDQYGQGPALILVPGGLQHRAFDQDTAELATLLAPHFTVIHYDRRGRGDSSDTLPYAVSREIEDIEALIDSVGGSAYLFGLSSGAALAMEASIVLGSKVRKMVMYEVPYDDDPNTRQEWMAYTRQLTELLSEGRRADAVSLFLTSLGTPAEELQQFSHAPVWPLFEAVAPTLAYDAAILGRESSIPLETARQVKTPTLLMAGGAESPYKHAMHETVKTLASVMPHAQTRILEGQDHFVQAAALAPVLVEFFNS